MKDEIVLSEICSIAEAYERIEKPIIEEVVLLGIATDSLPVWMDIRKPYSHNFIVWDRVVGQGILLIKTAIEFILRYKTGQRTEFVIISNNTKEWSGIGGEGMGVGGKNECVAVVPFNDGVTEDILLALSRWCYDKTSKSSLLLFVDGLENLESMSDEALDNLKFVISNGRPKGIYVVATARFENKDRVSRWVHLFQSSVFGTLKKRWFKLDNRSGDVEFFTPVTSL